MSKKNSRLFALSKPKKIGFDGFPLLTVHLPSSTGCSPTQIAGRPAGANDEEGSDDQNSIISRTSTNATMADIPGTGRLIDKFIYQRFGRKLERAIGRLSLSFLPPGVLAQRILEMQRSKFIAGADISVPHAFEIVNKATDGAAVIAGLKCLAKQARSGSLQQRAVALAGLIQISSTCNLYKIFFKNLVQDGLLEQYGNRLKAAELSESEELSFTLLGGLATTTLLTHQYQSPSSVLAQWLRVKLLAAMVGYQLKRYDPLMLVSLVHHIFSESASCVLNLGLHNRTTTDYIEDILELTCQCSAFLVRALSDLCQGPTSDPFRTLLISLHIHLVRESIHGICQTYTCNTEVAKPRMLLLLFGLNRHIQILAPSNDDYRNFSNEREINDSFFQMVFLSMPYSVRLWMLIYYNNHPGTSSYFAMLSIGAIEKHSLPLPSFDEIIEEVKDGFMRDDDDNEDAEHDPNADEQLIRTRAHARKVSVHDAYLTLEFKEAREPNESDGSQEEWYQLMKWKSYKKRLEVRKVWGEYLRSSYDWDWDVSGCLNRLFKVRRRRSGVRGVIRVHEGEDDGQLDVSISVPETSLPRTIRVAVVSESGEVTYKMYQECPEPTAFLSPNASCRSTGVASNTPIDLETGQDRSGKERFRATCEDADDTD